MAVDQGRPNTGGTVAVILLPLHIIAGSIAIIAGFIAVFVFKGGRLHRKSGMIFVYSMLVLSLTGAVIAAVRNQPGSVIGGLLAFYMVTTALLTVRRRDPQFHWTDGAAMLLGIAVGVWSIRFGFVALNRPSGTLAGVPATMLFIFGGVAMLAVLGDIRMMLGRRLDGTHRIARHLWRMCFSLFIASGSFFLGQAKVIPKPIRIMPLLAIPALLPLVLLLYWLVRVLFTKWYRRRASNTVAVA
ncbi:MAG: hypothetical protein M3P12_14875 [Gemmatimonadota bacterium]|nr:hypothetical protein [Gemmatimonadota bacterium]